MNIRAYLSGNPTHDGVIKAFAEGCGAELVRAWKYEPSDIAVVFGVYKSKIKASWERGKIIQKQRDKNLDVIVLETGYINRGDGENHHYAAGWNGLNGRANFKTKGVDGERWKKLNTQLRPYSRGEKILLCGQVPWDASCEGSDHKKWVKTTAAMLKKVTDRPIVVRPHPLAVDALPPILDCEYSTAPLEADFLTAHAVVTWNSNTAVDALIWGKPVFAFDEGSMAWDIANKSLLDIDTPEYPRRETWANELAYKQWTTEEMRQGLAWKHLSR